MSLRGVCKAFPRWEAGRRTTRDLLTGRLPVLRRFGDQRWVVRDVTLDVAPGESVALIGANGAGKSTLLRLAAGLGRPTRGQATVQRPLRAILSLGELFDLTLSGRENAVTTAVVAGLREREARARLPDILAFAELEGFADAPVRTYSEGMKLRLGMSVALHLPSRVYIVDEVLAVGDARFQQRCLEHMRERRREGAGLLLASHDLDRVAGECDRAVWLSAGSVRAAGAAETVVDAYRSALMSETLERTPAASGAQGPLELGRTRFGSQAATVEQVVFGQPGEDVHGWIRAGAPISVSLRLLRHDPSVERCLVSVAIRRRQDGVKCLSANSDASGVEVVLAPRGADVTVAYDRLPLTPGDYDVEVGAYTTDWSYAYDLHTGVYSLRVVGDAGDDGLLDAPHRWRVAACD